MNTPKVRRGPWIEEKNIGSGGFGAVVLWKNEETEEEIAVKKCRLQNEMTNKHKHRWQLEVDIMKRLDNENVVRATDVPPELEVGPGEMPILVMEYCSGGDLRKVLNKPENCCGLKECQIRSLIRDIANGIEYLHSRRIIHRDLKPENIVLQECEGRVIYKLIDLGYAKELDQGSVCTSFVGTLQYLAPELFESRKYTCTVDYWSFGTVVFESITGVRPFLPSLPPVQWHQHVSKKSNEQICAYFNNKNEVEFSNTIPPHVHLCRTTKIFMTQFLQNILMWDQKMRGGGYDDKKRAKCFILLERILQTKVIHILCVVTNQLLTYPIQDHNTLNEIQKVIEAESKVPLSDQEILFATGLSPDATKPVAEWFVEPNSEEDFLAFLFLRHDSKIRAPERKRKPLPESVQQILKEPTTILPYQEQKKAWGHAVYFCGQRTLEYRRLLQAQRAALMSLLRLNSALSKQKSRMSKDVAKLQAKIDFFRQCVIQDLEKYREQATSGGITSEKRQRLWKQSLDDLGNFSHLEDQVNTMEYQSTGLQTKLVEVQRSPYARNKHGESLEEIEKATWNLYQDLRQLAREKRHGFGDNTRMVQLVVQCITTSDKIVDDLYMHLKKLSSMKSEVKSLLPALARLLKDIQDFSDNLNTQQKIRQNDIWKMINVAVTGANKPFQLSGQKDGALMSQASIDMTSSTQSGMFFEKNMEQSMIILSDVQSTRHKLESVMGDVVPNNTRRDRGSRHMQDFDEDIDWSFLAIETKYDADQNEQRVI